MMYNGTCESKQIFSAGFIWLKTWQLWMWTQRLPSTAEGRCIKEETSAVKLCGDNTKQYN